MQIQSGRMVPLKSDANWTSVPMRPKARWLAQHGGGPPGWMEDSDQAGCDFVHDGWSMPPALTDHTAGPGLGLLSCERLAIPAAAAAAGLLLNVHKQPT
jgi:hypothetical protein